MTRLRNQDDINDSVANEKKAQEFMDLFYTNHSIIIDRQGACKQFDLTISQNGITKKVEEKFRQKDWGDFLVEFYQCIEEPPQHGWFYETTADYLNYVICDPDWKPSYFYKVYWGKFKAWLIEYLKQNNFPKVLLSPKGIGLSLNFSINWTTIPKEYYRKIDLEANP